MLTDDATRENYEKYGNPDGYHGTSVTIGLPSWLTNKDNELAILVAYFLIIIVVIPVIVGLWWRNSSKFLEDGVMQSTAFRFYRQVQENTATKYVPGILATAVEFCEGAPCKNATADDLSKLHRRVSPHFVKNQGDSNNDIMKIKTLLYAHLLANRCRRRCRPTWTLSWSTATTCSTGCSTSDGAALRHDDQLIEFSQPSRRACGSTRRRCSGAAHRPRRSSHQQALEVAGRS